MTGWYESTQKQWKRDYTRLPPLHDGDDRYYTAYRDSQGRIYIDWSGTAKPGKPGWEREWGEDFTSLSRRPSTWTDVMRRVYNSYGPESSSVHHIGYSRGGAFARFFGGQGEGSLQDASMPAAVGSVEHKAESYFWDPTGAMFHQALQSFEDQAGMRRFTQESPWNEFGPRQMAYDPPVSQRDAQGNSHTFAAMPYGASTSAGAFRGGAGGAIGYRGNQTRSVTEEHGDLNTYNRVFQFYTYHAEKRKLLEEYCRGLAVSLCRIQNGTVGPYDEPLAWPFPVRTLPQTGDNSIFNDNDAFLDRIVMHFKDNRRLSATFGMTISSFSGKSMSTPLLPPQHDADYWFDAASANGLQATEVLLWIEENVEVSPGTFVDRRRMKTLQELGYDLADVFEEYSKIDPGLGIDIIPCRIQILKKTRMRAHNETQSREIYDVVYDDDNFARSKVYCGAYTTVTWQNVTPASGDVLMQQDPLAADTINHVPLKGKIYTFSGPVPKVWDKHRAEMHELFKPEFFEGGRYLLPNSKLHNIDEFAKPPRGKSIWSNCIGEQSIGIGPGQFKKLRLNYRVNDTLEEFFKRYRDADVDHLKMGRTVCLCLEPAIRRQHIGEPIPYAAVKLNGGKEVTVSYEPYTYTNIETDPTKLPRWKKMLRPLFSFPTLDETRASAHPADTAGVHFWYKDSTSPFGAPEGLIKGSLIGDTSLGADFATREEDEAATILLHNKVICEWTDGPGRVSKGDPLMFNVQINRLYTGAARLRREAFLTVDNSGIKRKWNERLVPNVGAGPAQNPADFFEDHELQSALQVGIREIVPEGQPGNLQVDSGGVHQISDITTVTGGGLTAAETTAAFVAALGQTGLDVAATGNTLMDLQNVTVTNPGPASEFEVFLRGRGDVDVRLGIDGPHYNVTSIREKSNPTNVESISEEILVLDGSKVYWKKTLDQTVFWVHYYGDGLDDDVFHVKKANFNNIPQAILNDHELLYVNSSGVTTVISPTEIFSVKPPMDVKFPTTASLVTGPEAEAYRKKFPDDIVLTTADVISRSEGDFTTFATNDPNQLFTMIGSSSTTVVKFFDTSYNVMVKGVDWDVKFVKSESDEPGVTKSYYGHFKKVMDGVDYWILPVFGYSIRDAMADRAIFPVDWSIEKSGIHYPYWTLFNGYAYDVPMDVGYYSGGATNKARFMRHSADFIQACDTAQQSVFITRQQHMGDNNGLIVRPLYLWQTTQQFDSTYYVEYGLFPGNLAVNSYRMVPGSPAYAYHPSYPLSVVYL